MVGNDYHIAVIDLGKTRKKLSVYTSSLTLLSCDSVSIPVKEIDGFEADDAESMMNWVLKMLTEKSKEFNIRVISTTTHGATAVTLDREGNLVFPVISYTNEPSREVKRNFYENILPKEKLAETTGSPVYDIALNVGYGLYWLQKEFPERWKKVKNVLFLPQYVSYVLTGKMSNDLTSLGCHTLLYDFNKKGWSEAAVKMGVVDLFPSKMMHPWQILGNITPAIAKETGLAADCVVTSGIHDSNASLLPYLIKYHNKFLLATTGTWCVFLKPDATFSLTMKELARDTLYYLDAFGNPSRASKFMGGDEHDYYVKKIKAKLGENPLQVKYNHELVQRIVRQKDCFILPTLHPGTGMFPKSKARIYNEEKFYSDVEYAYHVLVLSLAIRSFVGLNQVIIDTCEFSVYIEGGFRNNQIYLNILASFFPGNDTYVTNRKEATSYGAAICGKCGLENRNPNEMRPEEIQIEKFKIDAKQINFSNLMGYFEKFISLCYDSEGIPDILDDLF